MIDENRVSEMLHRRANAVPTIAVDAPKAARRARRRLLANGAVAMLAAAAIAVATFAGVEAIRSAPIPANPTPSPAPRVLRANGEVLSFTGVPFESPGDLVTVNPDTGQERILVEDLDDVYSASWSADGRWVAYETRAPEGTGLWVVSASQEPRQVVAGPSTWVWSSTGAELAAIRLRSLDSNLAGSTLTTIDPASGETTTAVSIPERFGDVKSGPAWSPDGTRFLFGNSDGAIYSIDVGSGASSLLGRLPAEHLGSVDQIVWSPDAAHIAVLNDAGVYMMDAEGSNVHVLQGVHSVAGVAWSPDGTRLAYQKDEGVIWAAPTDGSDPTKIGRPLPTGCYLLCPSDLIWSPDGSRIAFRSIWIRVGDASVDVSTFDADGRGDAERIDELTYQSWEGGSYSGEYG